MKFMCIVSFNYLGGFERRPPYLFIFFVVNCIAAFFFVFVIGGNDDKTGSVQRDMLFKIIKQDFGLCTDMEKLYKSLGTQVEGVIEYEDFRQMLRETPAGK